MTNVSMDEIRKMVSLQLGIRDVTDDSLLVEDLSAESADVANLIASLEERYLITFSETEIAGIRTPADLFELVKGKVSN